MDNWKARASNTNAIKKGINKRKTGMYAHYIECLENDTQGQAQSKS